MPQRRPIFHGTHDLNKADQSGMQNACMPHNDRRAAPAAINKDWPWSWKLASAETHKASSCLLWLRVAVRSYRANDSLGCSRATPPLVD